jgi:hypothetical protein
MKKFTKRRKARWMDNRLESRVDFRHGVEVFGNGWGPVHASTRNASRQGMYLSMRDEALAARQVVHIVFGAALGRRVFKAYVVHQSKKGAGVMLINGELDLKRSEQ